MTLLTHNLDLTNATFPFLSELQGRTVIVGATGDAPAAPQLYYAHNVLPTPYGYQSIGYLPFIPSAGATNFVSVHTLRTINGNRTVLMGVTADGRLFILRFGDTAWFELPSIPGIAGKKVSTAFVRGVTYIYFSTVGCYQFAFDFNNLTPVTLTGLNPTKVFGVTGLAGYLITYGTGNVVAWSSILNPTDFVPSLTTGAGAGLIDGAQGDTTDAIAIYGGIIFLCRSNSIAAIFQANQRFPFNFVQIMGSGGISPETSVAVSATDSPVAYVYTTSGLQAISLRQAEFIIPEATEFLSGSRLEDFDEVNFPFTITNLTAALYKKTTWIADRYIVISYGQSTSAMTHAIVVDTALNRVGKLRVDHVACFEFTLYDQTRYETPKKSIGILKADGSIQVVNTDVSDTSSFGVAIFGKYQYVRTRLTQLQEVVFENILSTPDFNVWDLPSLDGKLWEAPITGYRYPSLADSLSMRFGFHNTAINHSLLCIGRFNIVSGQIKYNIHGKK